MRVTANDRGHTGGLQIEIEFSEVVKHVDHMTAKSDKVVCWKAVGPRTMVIISSDRSDWSDRSEGLQNGMVTDVATMNNQVRVAERLERLWPDQPMRIGDDTDQIAGSQHLIICLAQTTTIAKRDGLNKW